MTILAFHRPEHITASPLAVASTQVIEAEIAMDRHVDAYLHLPFRDLDALVGGIPPGTVGFVCAFSGGGKTAFIASAVMRWIEAGKRVYVMPLESEANTFRTHLACKTLNYHAGMVLSGEYKRSLPAPAWAELRQAVKKALYAQLKGNMAERLFVSPVSAINETQLIEAAEHAAELKADVLIIDHIDHVAGGDGSNLFAESTRVVDTTLELAKQLKISVVATSQLNNSMLHGDRLGVYQPPQAQHVYMGGKKRQVAAWFLGLYRPLRLNSAMDPEWGNLLKDARAGSIEPQQVLEPNCMGVSLMKHRLFGEREGKRCFLHVNQGKVEDMDPLDLAAAEHGITTHMNLL